MARNIQERRKFQTRRQTAKRAYIKVSTTHARTAPAQFTCARPPFHVGWGTRLRYLHLRSLHPITTTIVCRASRASTLCVMGALNPETRAHKYVYIYATRLYDLVCAALSSWEFEYFVFTIYACQINAELYASGNITY